MRSIMLRGDRGRFDVKMTPMIDVVFQLLIFFLCTASFQALEESLPTTLAPSGASQAEAPPEELELLDEVLVRVEHHEGQVRWRVNERPCERLQQLRELLDLVARIRTDVPVILDVDPEVALGDVIDVYDLCRLAGFERIQFAASAEA